MSERVATYQYGKSTEIYFSTGIRTISVPGKSQFIGSHEAHK